MRHDNYAPVVVVCEFCTWKAQHPDPRNTDNWTEADIIEASATLRARLFAHIAEAHPERGIQP